MVNSPISSSVNRFTSGVISISSSTALSAALLELFVFVFVAMHLHLSLEWLFQQPYMNEVRRAENETGSINEN
jgi:hypothetical protein